MSALLNKLLHKKPSKQELEQKKEQLLQEQEAIINKTGQEFLTTIKELITQVHSYNEQLNNNPNYQVMTACVEGLKITKKNMNDLIATRTKSYNKAITNLEEVKKIDAQLMKSEPVKLKEVNEKRNQKIQEIENFRDKKSQTINNNFDTIDNLITKFEPIIKNAQPNVSKKHQANMNIQLTQQPLVQYR